MALISMNIASKKVTAPAYKHVGVLSIEIKTTCSTDRRKLRVTIIFLSLKKESVNHKMTISYFVFITACVFNDAEGPSWRILLKCTHPKKMAY